MTTTCGGAIAPQDFSNNVTDTNRYRWTYGKMALAVEAIDGQPVAIILDNGFALVGVRLLRVQKTGSRNPGARVVVESTESGVTNYLISDVTGPIIVLDESGKKGAKWVALDLMRTRGGEAISVVRADAEAEGMTYGKWTYEAYDAHEFGVTYTPQKEDAGKRTAWRVNVKTKTAVRY